MSIKVNVNKEVVVSHPFEKKEPVIGPHPTSTKIMINFDGYEFSLDHQTQSLFDTIPLLYMCNKAREGDKAAIELLTQAKIAITDCNSASYWPITKEEEIQNG